MSGDDQLQREHLFLTFTAQQHYLQAHKVIEILDYQTKSNSASPPACQDCTLNSSRWPQCSLQGDELDFCFYRWGDEGTQRCCKLSKLKQEAHDKLRACDSTYFLVADNHARVTELHFSPHKLLLKL